MEDFYKHGNRLTTVITLAYFVIAMSEIMSELFFYTPLIVIFKPLMPLTLIALYWFSSPRRQPLYMAAMLLSSVTNLMFIPNDLQMLRLALIVFTVHRILVITLIFRMLKLRDYIPVVIGTVPFLLVFFYMLVSSDVPENTFWVMVIQNILISVIGGVAVSNYMMQDNKKNSWLLICGLLFVALQFIVFVEKYYLMGFSPSILRPTAMALNAFAFYTFYEFVMTTEKSDDNGTSG